MSLVVMPRLYRSSLPALFIALAAGIPAAAEPVPAGIPVTVDCINQAALDQQVPPEILYAIGVIEGGKVGDRVFNKNGSYDLGVFQINSHWLKTLAAAYRTDPATVEYHLRWNGCFSAAMAAWVLRKKILDGGGDFWRGVGDYNSTNPPYHDRYLNKVVQRLRLMLRDR